MLEKIQASLAAVRQYLQSGKSLEQFDGEHGIKGKALGGLIILDYSQINVRWSEPHGFACRGLVLNEKNLEVVGFVLSKFWNSSEGYAAPIDWNTARVFEKIDGSLVNRWHNPHTGQFEYSTRFQLPENIRVNTANSGIITWENLIQRCLGGWEDILARQPTEETWAFECCSPQNQIVVRHQGFYAKLLAIRNNKTLVETDIETLPWLPADKRPKSYHFNNAAEVAKFANTIPASQNEGFVVLDGQFNRIKIKSDQYVALHRLKDGLSGINNLILLARGNDYEEVVGHFPEYKEDLDIVAGLINETVARHEAVFEECKSIVSQKDFALEIQKRGLESTACLFLTRAGKKPSIKTAFAEMADTPFLGVFKARIKQALGNKYADEIMETEVK